MTQIRCYQPSGRVGALAYVLGPVLGLLVASTLGWAYVWLVEVIPFIYINALLTAAYGGAVGLAVGLGLRLGKCRHVEIGVGLGVIIGLIAASLTHYWTYQLTLMTLETELGQGAAVGGSFIEYIKFRAESGWDINSLNISGFLVYIIWLIEIAIIVTFSTYFAKNAATLPYCEDTNTWAKGETLGQVRHVAGPAVQAAATNDNLKGIIWPEGKPVSDYVLIYNLYRCRGGLLYLDAILKWPKSDGKSEEKDVVKYAEITEDELARVMQTLKEGARVEAPEDKKLPAPKLAAKQQQLGAASTIPKAKPLNKNQ